LAFLNCPKKKLLVHGEKNQPADELLHKIREHLIVLVPLMGQEFEI
jgi:hypothetical protein